MHTADFRRQHDSARSLIRRIELTIATAKIEAIDLSRLIIELGGLLRIHFAMEDRVLYPALIKSTSCEAAQTARIYHDEMGDISPRFNSFVERWRVPTAISADPAGVRLDCATLLPELIDRIGREDRVLYPLADIAFPSSRNKRHL